jgi:serine/threonine-protein kinase
MPLVSGATAAGFSIVRLLGCGQIGELYLAEHPRLPRRHALKILPADVSADPDYRERFNRESDLAATLWHPHIVGLYDRGEFEGRLWLSMDYVEGADAAQLLRDTYPDGMPPDEVVEIVSAIADALDYAHAHGLLHRYVKPSNILITQPPSDKRRILLAGLGVARRLDDINSLTQTNTTFGAVSYAAPEQLMGDSIDGRADQYALAGTAFHLLTGSPPFAHSNPAVVISRHLNEAPPRPGNARPELAHFDETFARALAKAPGDRFPRCRDFAAALEANHTGQSGPRDAGAAAVATRPAASPAPEPSPEPEPSPAAASPPDAEPDTMALTEPAAASLRDAETDTFALTQPPVPAPPDAEGDDAFALFEPEPDDAVAPPDILSGNRIVDIVAFDEPAESGAATDDTPVTSRRRRLLHTAAFSLTIVVVLLVAFVIVMALRSASGFKQSPANVETPSPVTTIPPAPPAPATATPPPAITAPVLKTTTPPISTLPPPATTLQSTSAPSPAEVVTPPRQEAVAPPTTTRRSPSSTSPAAGLDTRPAVGMPCGPQQSGTTTVSNSGIPVSCVGTPGGFAWEPPGG